MCCSRFLALALVAAGLLAEPFASLARESPRVHLSGHVQDFDPEHYVGARVSLHRLRPEIRALGGLLDGEPRPAAVSTVAIEPSGRFVLAAPAAGVYGVTVEASGHGSMTFQPIPIPSAEVAGVYELPPVVLDVATPLPLRVVAEDGNPLVAARVQGVASPAAGERASRVGWRPTRREAWTDSEGRAVLWRLPDEALDLMASAGGDLFPARARRVTTATRLVVPTGPDQEIRVRTPDGRPAGGVLLILEPHGWPLGRTDEGGRWVGRLNVRALAQIRALGNDGSWAEALLRPTPRAAPPEPSSTSADGSTSEDSATSDSATEAPLEPWVLTLSAPRRIRGKVVDTKGRPVADALVFSDLDTGLPKWSDSRGEYDLPRTSTRPSWLRAYATGHTADTQRLETSHLVPAFELRPTRTVRGRVTDPGGRPLEGVEILAVGGPRQLPRDTVSSRGRSDSEGRFVLPGLAAQGVYGLVAQADGQVPSSRPLMVAAQADTPLDWILTPARPASGQVFDLDDRPLVGIRVTAKAVDARMIAGPSPEATTDADGRFELAYLPSPRFDLEASGEGFLPTVVRGLETPPPSDDSTAENTLNEDRGIEDRGIEDAATQDTAAQKSVAKNTAIDLGTLILSPGVTLGGRVTDLDGNPVEKARLWVLEPRETHRTGLPRTPPDATSNRQGEFELGPLEVGRQVTVLADHWNHRREMVPGLRIEARNQPLAIELRKGASLRGRVVDLGGAAVSGAEVTLHGLGAGVGQIAPQAESLGERQTTQTNAEGEFAFTALGLGRLGLRVTAQGFQASESELVLEHEAPEEDLEILLQPGVALRGRVTESEGRPISGARLVLADHVARSDSAGEFVFEGLSTGPRTLTVRHDEYDDLERELVLETDNEPLQLILDRGLPVAGTVVDGDGSPLPGVAVRLTQIAGMRRYDAITTPEGRFELASVVEGAYHLEALALGYARAVEPRVEVSGQGIDGLKIVLGRGAMLAGSLVGLDFEEIAAVEVVAEGDHGNLPGAVRYDGHYSISGLSPGFWQVSARLRSGERHAEAVVRVRDHGEELERDLVFEGSSLRGRVVFDQQVLPGARVSLRDYGRLGRRTTVTGTEGTFLFEDLAPGRYHLAISHPREALLHNEELNLFGDEDIEVELDAARLQGTVRDRDTEEPILDVVVRLQHLLPSGERSSVTALATDENGSFVIERLAPGLYELQLHKTGYLSVTDRLEVASGEAPPLELSLEPASGLELTIESLDIPRPPFITVASLGPTGELGNASGADLDREGNALLSTLPPGDHLLLVGAPGSAVARLQARVPGPPRTVVLGSGNTLDLRIPALEESSDVAQLQIFEATTGQPLWLVDDRGLFRDRWGLIAGRLRLPGLPQGSWGIRATAPDGRTWQGAFVATQVSGQLVEWVLE